MAESQPESRAAVSSAFTLRSRAKRGLREGEPRTRYLTHAEETQVLAATSAKTRQAVIFAIDTGLRKEEQFSLQ
ncbi:MAG TPA: hypothetical protein VFP29_05230, partial [Methyloceanibacter sp.]|nr:hypothetical protein [Methyloceanibacter sp.]